MAAYNTAANNTGPKGSSSDSDRAKPRTFVVNINGNSGIVVLGENNALNVYTSPPSAATGVGRKCDDYATTDARPKSYHCVPFSRGKRSLNDEGFAASASSQQLYQNCKRAERRKEGSLANKVSEFVQKKKKGRKRMKRQKINSRSSTPSSDDEAPGSALNAELALESGNNSSFKQGLRSFHSLTKRLQPLRDNGRWADFDRVAQQLLKQTGGDMTRKIIIYLEKSVALSYQRKLEESEDMLNGELNNIAQTGGSVRLLLEVLSNCYLAQLYRRRKMLGKTNECLHTAKKVSSSFPPCLPVVILLYEEGSYKRDFAAMLHGSGKELAIGEAKKFMQSCADLCYRLDTKEVYVQKQQFAVSKMASMDLQCETTASRQENINSGNIEEAGKRLQTLQTDSYCKNEVQGAKIQRLKAEVDLYYRIDEFAQAEKTAEEALEIAERLGFKLEKKPFEDRLKDIRRKMTESPEPLQYGVYRATPRAIDSSSGSPSSKNNTPNSSE